MPAPATTEELLDLVKRSDQVDLSRLAAFLSSRQRGEGLPPEPRALASLMVREGLLTKFQAEQLLQGKYRGFAIGGYRILEKLGSGGSGTVYLAEHEVMRRRVALKVLPADYASEPGVLARFQREAQAGAALDHPNIVRAYDFRNEGTLHFLVMEHVDGASLQELLSRQGPLPVGQACDYVRQAALGLQHAHEANLVHRDVKPANLLVDRAGTVKVLDLGLARFSPRGEESLTQKFDENAVMGTADYLAPEQALNMHDVDIRVDVYSLGATLYALLAGAPPFHAGTVTQKLLWHQMREPKPLRSIRPDVPAELEAVIKRMMAKAPEDRYEAPWDVAEALLPWSEGPFPPDLPDRPGGTGSSVVLAGSSTRVPERTPSPTSAAMRTARGLASVPHREPAPEPEVSPRGVARRPLAREPFHLWLAFLGGGAVLLVLLATAGVGFFLWRAAHSARPQVAATVKPPEEPDQPPALDAQAAFELPDEPGELFRLDGHRGAVLSVAYSPFGSYVLSASEDKTVRLWDLKNRALRAEVPGHADQVTSVAFSRDGRRALTSSLDRTIRVWELPGGLQQFSLGGDGAPLWQAVYSQDEREVLSGSADGTLRLWDVPARKPLRSFLGHGKGKEARCVAFAPMPRRQALSGGTDNLLRLWDVNSGNQVRSFVGHTATVTSVVFLADGRRAISASQDGTLRLWELDSGKQLKTYPGHQGPVWAVAVSRDGRRALSGGEDRTVRLWDVDGGRALLQTHSKHTGPVTSVAFGPDGRHGASGGRDKTVRIWSFGP